MKAARTAFCFACAFMLAVLVGMNASAPEPRPAHILLYTLGFGLWVYAGLTSDRRKF